MTLSEIIYLKQLSRETRNQETSRVAAYALFAHWPLRLMYLRSSHLSLGIENVPGDKRLQESPLLLWFCHLHLQ